MPGPKVKTLRDGRLRIPLLLVEPHPFVRDGMRVLLEQQPDLRVIGAFGEAGEAVRHAEALRPRVVMMDMAMPGLGSIDATRLLRARIPEVGVVILSAHSLPAFMRRAVEAGALAFVAKDVATEEVLQAVRSAAAGERYVSRGLVDVLFELRKGGPRDIAAEILTPTERNILKLVVEGKSNFEAAATVGLSPRTVETYRGRLMRKLGIDSLPSLVRYAIRQGIIGLD